MGIQYFNELPDMGQTAVQWFNDKAPPAIGQRVRITINSIGEGTVLRYYTQESYLGVVVKVDKWPDRFQKEDGTECHCFGPEISY